MGLITRMFIHDSWCINKMSDECETKSQLVHKLEELGRKIAKESMIQTGEYRTGNYAIGSITFAECILETIRESLLVLDSDLKVIFANRSFYKIFKVTQKETIGNYIYELGNHQWDIPRLRMLLEEILSEDKSFDGLRVEHHFAIIGYKVMMLNARQIYQEKFNKNQLILLAIEDISERVQLEKALISMSITDELTGLYNRRGLFNLGNKLLQKSKRQKKGLFMLYVDLDHLKDINDSFGHKEGDKALITIAEVLKEHYRKSDIIARIGGDEFVVFPVGNAGDSTKHIISRLQKAVALCNFSNDLGYELSLSAGIAYYDPKIDSSFSELLNKGDKLMYEEKQKKLLPYQFISPGLYGKEELK